MKRFKTYIKDAIDLPAKSLEIDRKDMPQVNSNDVGGLIGYLNKRGVESSNVDLDPRKLKATQSQFHKAKIQSIVDGIQSGDVDKKPIIVSKDMHVIDGHHQWLAHRHLNLPIPTIVVDAGVSTLLDMMSEYPKSYTKKLYESSDVVLLQDGAVCSVITKAHMDAFEQFVDRLFAKFKIDFDFTRHFRDRMADGRNTPCIDIKELAGMIQKIYKQKAAGSNVFRQHPDTEVVIKDIQTDLNMPIAIEYDRKADQIRVITKTIMRKKNFRTPNKEIKI